MRQYSHLLRFQGAGQLFITNKEDISAESLEQTKGARNRVRIGLTNRPSEPVLELLNNLWGLGPIRNRVVVPARQAK